MKIDKIIYCVYLGAEALGDERAKYDSDECESFTSKPKLKAYIEHLVSHDVMDFIVLTEWADDEIYRDVQRYQPNYISKKKR